MPYVANAAPTTKAPPALNSRYACVIDVDAGHVLYTKRAADVYGYPASTVKIMTMLLICELKGDVLDSETVTWQTSDDLDSGYSQVGFIDGDVVTWRDLLMGGLLWSGGDAMQAAARVLGNEDAGNALTSTDGYARFVEMMNERAAELGMTRSYFSNGHGADIHRATARDWAVLAGVALARSEIVAGYALTSYSIDVTGPNARSIAVTITAGSPLKETLGILSAKHGTLNYPDIVNSASVSLMWRTPSGNRVAISTLDAADAASYRSDHLAIINALPTDFPYLNPWPQYTVRSSGTTYVTAISQNQTIPVGTASGDLLLAFVMHRAAITPPAGWTLVKTQFCNYSGFPSGQSASVYQKTAGGSDSGASTTWTQASSNRMAVHIYSIYNPSGSPSVIASASAAQNSVDVQSIPLPTVAATANGQIGIGFATVISAAVSSTFTPPTGFTLTTPGTSSDNRMAVAYYPKPMHSSYTVKGTFTQSSTGENGSTAITLLIGVP